MRLLLIMFCVGVFCVGCVDITYLKEDYIQVNGKIYLSSIEKVKYHSNDENLSTTGLALNLSKDNGSKLNVGGRIDKGDPNLIRAYGLAGKDVIGTINGTNVIEGALK